MAIDAFEATICKHYKVDRIKLEIQKSNALGELGQFDPYPLNAGIVAVTNKAKDIPPFSHPIDMGGWIVFDARGYTTLTADGNVKLNNGSMDEFKFHYLRALLQQYVNINNIKELRKVSAFPALVFCNWIGRSLAQRLSLEPDAQMNATIIAGIYYYSLFEDSKDLLSMDERDKNEMCNWVSRITTINLTEVLRVSNQLEPMTDIEGLVNNIKQYGGSLRYEKMNKGFLTYLLSHSWFGNNSSEIVIVALEHPVTWIAIIERALNARGYNNCAITKQVEFYNKNDIGRTFLKNLTTIPAFENANF